MNANKIEAGKIYEVTVGKNSTSAKVTNIERRVNGQLVFECLNTKTGKPMVIADAKRFVKEVKPAKPKAEKKSLRETIESKGITIIPKGKRATKTMSDLDDPTFTRKHHVNENGVLVLEAENNDVPKRERTKAARADGTVSGIDGAYLVLKEAGEALNIKQIMERINEKSLCRLSGLTPSATVSAAMQRDILHEK